MSVSRRKHFSHYFKLAIGFKNPSTIPIETSPIFYSSIHSFGNARSFYSLKYRKNLIHFDVAKVKEESRFDGKFVLTTNTELSSEEVAITYKNLLQVEYAFRYLKDTLETRSIYHRRPENTKGHVFCELPPKICTTYS